jgi:hypothetical protein
VSVCSQPSSWCTGYGVLLTRTDCDGDGILDLACMDSAGGRGAILSKRSCSSETWATQWPNAPMSLCPAAFSKSLDCASSRKKM